MSLIVCRKCGGDHLTIKCGKTKDEKPVEEKPVEKQEDKIENNNQEKLEDNKEKLEETKEKLENNKEIRRYDPKVSYRVKISELPNDVTEDEMMELCNNWGYITKLKVINYEDTSVAYIDFNKEECADYFVEALHRTPFEHLILNVTRVEANY
jgi:hypothetical protein